MSGTPSSSCCDEGIPTGASDSTQAFGINAADQLGGNRTLYFIPPMEDTLELKNRKKLEPTSMARPAVSAASISSTEVIPLLPSAAGQSLWSKINTGRTSHHIGSVLRKPLSTIWS